MTQQINIHDLINGANPLVKQIADSVEVVELKNTITISNKRYKIKLLKWSDGIVVWEDIMKRLLPSVGTGIDRFNYNEMLDGSPTTFAQALTQLSTNLDGSVLHRYSIALLRDCTVDGNPLDLESFSGNYGDWKKLFMFALKENFSSFFEEGWTDTLSSLTAMVVPAMTTSE